MESCRWMGVPVREYLGDVLPRLGIGVRGPDGERGGGTHAVGMGQTENVLAVFRKRSFLSVWPVWGWQHHPRRRREIIFPVSLNSRIIGDLPCPITRRRSPFAFGVATMRNATPCLRFARVVIAANAIVGLLADSALVAHKWPPPGGVIKRQTQEGKLTVSDNLGTGTVPPSRA